MSFRKDILDRRGLLLLAASLFLLFFSSCSSISQVDHINSQKAVKKNKSVKNQENISVPIEIIFIGDMMFDRYIRWVAMKKGNDFILEGVKGELLSADLVVGNLEGPITTNPSRSMGSEFESRDNYYFTFDPGWAKTLNQHNIKIVSLGNNHVLNFGRKGLAETKEFLQRESVDYFGDPTNENNYLVKPVGDIKIGLVSYNYTVKNSANKTLEDILKAKNQSDIMVVYAHWGKEYSSEAIESQKVLAQKFVDQGADLIVGSHSHVIQPREVYKNSRIYYSLGNFVFDQYFDPRTMEGLMVKVSINPKSGKLNFEEKRVQMKNNGQTMLMTNDKYQMTNEPIKK